MRAALISLLLMLPSRASAQGDQAEQPSISSLRACVRAHAADAQAAGVRTPGEAENYFIRQCVPLVGMSLNPNNLPTKDDDRPLAPGIYRKVIKDEWSAFLEGANRR